MRRLINKTLSYLPSKLPVGMAEFHKFSDEIIALSGPYADADSMKFAIASQIIHLGPQRSAAPKNFFVASLRKAAANQVASQVFQDIKLKQQRAAEEAAKQQAEVTATDDKAITSNGQAQ